MNLNPIRNFLDGSSMNAWIQVEDFEIYVRDTRHLLCRGRMGNTLTLLVLTFRIVQKGVRDYSNNYWKKSKICWNRNTLALTPFILKV